MLQLKVFIVSAFPRDYVVRWERQQDVCAEQRAPTRSAAASLHAAVSSQPQPPQTAVGPALSDRQATRQKQNVCLQPGTNVCTAYHMAQKCRSEFFCYFLIVCCSCLKKFVCAQVTANDLQDNLNKLNNGIAFLIKHSQKLFRVRPWKPN